VSEWIEDYAEHYHIHVEWDNDLEKMIIKMVQSIIHSTCAGVFCSWFQEIAEQVNNDSNSYYGRREEGECLITGQLIDQMADGPYRDTARWREYKSTRCGSYEF
jgi:hypothetical protein